MTAQSSAFLVKFLENLKTATKPRWAKMVVNQEFTKCLISEIVNYAIITLVQSQNSIIKRHFILICAITAKLLKSCQIIL